MTDEELAELFDNCPTLYHMAEADSWQSIHDHGLLSTKGLLDRYEVTGAARQAVESERRPESVTLTRAGMPAAVIRDQKPMTDSDLVRCLLDGLSPSDWYETLNEKVFFWTSRARLLRLLCAGAYEDYEHDVLEIDAAALLADHRNATWLCAMNSGCTKPYPHPRGMSTFSRIVDYPYDYWRHRRSKVERVVEVAVDYSVPNIGDYVRRVSRMKAGAELHEVWVAA